MISEVNGDEVRFDDVKGKIEGRCIINSMRDDNSVLT